MAEEVFFKYMKCGGGETLGEPLTTESVVQDKKGLMGIYRDFEGGSIYWTSKTRANVVKENILKCWRDEGAQNTLGYPTNDQEENRLGWPYSKFQKGTIYYIPEKDICRVHIAGKSPQDIWRWVTIVTVVAFFLAFAIFIGVVGHKTLPEIILSIASALLSPLAGTLVAYIWPASGITSD